VAIVASFEGEATLAAQWVHNHRSDLSSPFRPMRPRALVR
jgi:hypothetical protein